jgi:hypothetical protein
VLVEERGSYNTVEYITKILAADTNRANLQAVFRSKEGT